MEACFEDKLFAPRSVVCELCVFFASKQALGCAAVALDAQIRGPNPWGPYNMLTVFSNLIEFLNPAARWRRWGR